MGSRLYLELSRWSVLTVVLSFALPRAFGGVVDSRLQYERGFQERSRILLQYRASIGGGDFHSAAAKLALGVDIDGALEGVRNALALPKGDMFFTYPLMGFYLHHRDRLPADLRDWFRRVWQTYTPYRGDTENHWVMYYTAVLLAAQTWPEMTAHEWFNGKDSRENYEEALGWLNFWTRTTTTIGQGEFDSPDYMPVYVAPWLLLYDFAEDPRLRLQAEQMLNWLLADFAVEHLNGMYVGGYSRVYEPAVYDWRYSGIAALGYLYFGATPFFREMRTSHAVWAALSSYRPPLALVNIATDRSKPYVHTETKRVRNVIRHLKDRNPPVYKTTYMTKDFALGSLQGGILQPIQQHTWGLNFVTADGRNGAVFTLHPYYSAYELTMFFPEEPKIMVSEVVKSKGTYNKPDKLTGGSPYEQTFQHRNAIIILYDIPRGTHYEHINGFLPKNLKAREETGDGWIFGHGGNTFFALFILKPHELEERDAGFYLFSHHRRNAVVLEAVSADDFESFSEFIDRIRRSRPDTTGFDQKLTLGYETLSGDRMVFTFGGRRLLNGRPVDLSKYKLFEGPFLNAEIGSQKLSMTYGREHWLLNLAGMVLRHSVPAAPPEVRK